MRRGRHIKTYTASYDSNVKVPGLSRTPDGRWRVFRDGKETRFVEPNEYRAVERAKHLLGLDYVAVTEVSTTLGEVLGPTAPPCVDDLSDDQLDRLTPLLEAGAFDHDAVETLPNMPVKLPVPDSMLYPWLRQQLLDHTADLAAKVGLPELVGWRRNTTVPSAALTLTKVKNTYKQHSPAKDKTKREALATFDRLVEHTQAHTLDDLTAEKLLAFRQSVEADPKLKSSGTRAIYYQRIRAVISFGLKVGLDAVQIRSALDRCKVLWTAEPMPVVKPKPIPPADFHKLLDKGGETWRVWLLLGLNLCLHLDEICGLKWTDFDVEAGTYAAIREKTRRQRIPRAAVLWPETLVELKKLLPQRGPYVLVSPLGTRFSANAKANKFPALRKLAKVSETYTFDSIRDGAYTAAAHASPDERLARVLGGHKAAGLQDNYVLRNPKIVKPACEAVYAAYGPFA